MVGEAATSDRPTAEGDLTALQPAGWPTPKGYANGVMGRGNTVLTGGLIGWDENEEFPEGFVAQVEQTLTNVLAGVAEAGGGPEHIARLTWYVRSISAYRASLAELGPIYRRVMGHHYPAMALVEVSDLVEPRAPVEIEATAVVPV
ncbi:RidA family protein [Aurantimonas marina]|uniref:RidA family protein n=1 Tax=Aurantimonas marina TaxID=2780508 RepID=UPI002FCDAAF6